MIKQKTNREKDSEKTRGKKRYLERIVQEHEAEEEIKTFDRGSIIEDSTNEGGTDRFDGFGSERR